MRLKEARALSSSFALLSLGRVGTIFATFFTVAIMARYLGAAGYGDYRLIIAILSLTTVLANLGTPLIVARELSKPTADQARVLGSAAGLRAVSVFTAIIVVVALSWAVSLRPAIVLGILCGSVGFIAVGLHDVFFTLFQQRLKQAGAVIAETAGASILVVLALVLARAEVGVLAFVLATAASSIVTAFISLCFARRLLAFSPRFRIDEWMLLLRPAAPIAVMNVLSLVYYRFDIIILGFLNSAEQVGFYGIPSKILDVIMGFTILFAGLVMPLMSRHAVHDVASFKRYFALGTATLMIATFGALSIIIVFAEEILSLVGGESFSEGANALRVLGLAAVVASIRYMGQQAITALDSQARLMRGFLLASIVGFVSYLVLIPRFGSTGAALGLLVGEGIIFLWASYILHQHGISLGLGQLLRVVFSGLATVGILMFLKDGVLPWFWLASLGGVIYLGLLLVVRGIPPDVIDLLKVIQRS
jgi:O-antigen/teichoic acid export membrane protein